MRTLGGCKLNDYEMSISSEYHNKNYALRKNELDSRGQLPQLTLESDRVSLTFFEIRGLSRFWREEELPHMNEPISNILSSIVGENQPFVFMIRGDQYGIHIFIGTSHVLSASLCMSFEAMIPGIDIRPVEGFPFQDLKCTYGGFFTGIPSVGVGQDGEAKDGSVATGMQIEKLCKAMLGHNFVYMVSARGVDPGLAAEIYLRLMEEMGETYSMIRRTTTGGALGNISIESQDYVVQDYFDNLSVLQEQLKIGTINGLWRVNGYFAADQDVTYTGLRGVIKTVFCGEDSLPETFRVTDVGMLRTPVYQCGMVSNYAETAVEHPLNRGGLNDLFQFKYQTVLNSSALGVLCNLPSVELPGYYLDDYVAFDQANRPNGYLNEDFVLGEIVDETDAKSKGLVNEYKIDMQDFTRHALIVGMTGGGKSNTSKSILCNLWKKNRIPFLVIESAKREYWELQNLDGYEELVLFTLGSEQTGNSVRYRLNPFECFPGISLQTHIDYLLSTFKASFELYPPMPYALETAVYEVYKDRGWDIAENRNLLGLTRYPTMTDLYNKIDVVVERLGYHKEVQSNVQAALKARINSLMIGGKGAMLDTPQSMPIGELLNRPVVMELEDLGDDDTKSFVMGILMVQLYEYRKSQMKTGSKKLQHVLLIEEAHRLLKNVPETGSEGGNAKAKSIEFFCNMLAEIRTYGQGLMIADQLPSKLAPDTVKNTNLKIVHRIVSQDDREIIGRAMNMTDMQVQYLSVLRRGVAAVYAEGDNKPKQVKFPFMKTVFDYDRVRILERSNQDIQVIMPSYGKKYHHHAGCTYCEEQCTLRSEAKKIVDSNFNTRTFRDKVQSEGKVPSIVTGVFTNKKSEKLKVIQDWCGSNINRHICVMGIILDSLNAVPEGKKNEVIANYLNKHFLLKE